MNVLLINNNTYYKKRLEDLLKRHQLTIISYDELSGFDVGSYDVIVLSGGGIMSEGRKRSLKRFSHLYQDQIKLVCEANVPIVGICLGCQIIGYAYGAELRRYFKTLRKGVFPIVAISQNNIMAGKEEAKVYQSNHWIITELPNDLICIAASNEGVEIIKHRDKPIWGVQFHPERGRSGGSGRKIFNRILNEICQEQSKH